MIEKKIGQMIITGFRGKSMSEGSLKILAKQIKGGKIGGLIFLNYNLENRKQILNLTKKLGEIDVEYPLFMAVDQEGGEVQRLSSKNGFKDFPPAEHIASLTEEEAYLVYYKMAEMLAEAGFNINLAPVVDINLNPDNPVIGKRKRSFSPDPDTVFRYAQIMIEAHNDVGVLTVLKHYPGYGSSKSDPHIKPVYVTESYREEELIPFKELIKRRKAKVIMTAHTVNKRVDPKFPASLSRTHLQEILRNRLGYKGVTITDDLQMPAITCRYSFEDTVVNALNAGNDILLFANYFAPDINLADGVIRAVLSAIDRGKIKEERVEESFNRIVELKKGLPSWK